MHAEVFSFVAIICTGILESLLNPCDKSHNAA